MSAERASTTGAIFFILFGPIVWAGHLLVVYGGHAVLCATGVASNWSLPIVPLLLWGTTGAALILLTVGLLWAPRLRRLLGVASGIEDQNGWLEHLMRLLATLSLFGVVYAGVAVLVVPQCAQLR